MFRLKEARRHRMPGWIWIYVAVACAGALLFRALTGPLRPPRFLPLVLTRAAVGFAALSPFVVGLVWFALEQVDNVPAVLSGAIGGTVVAVGWVVAFGLRQFETLKEREQAAVDTMYVLRAEIFAAVAHLDSTDWESSSKTTQTKIKKGGNAKNTRYMPFTLTESPPVLFRAVSDHFASLPAGTIRPVAEFYTALNDLTTLADDFKRNDFIDLDVDIRVGAHKRITRARLVALQRGINALYALNLELGDRDPDGQDSLPRTGKNPQIELQKDA